MSSVPAPGWSATAEAAYRKRVSDIGLRFIAYTRWILANETYQGFPASLRQTFVDGAFAAIREGEKAYSLPDCNPTNGSCA